VSIFKKQFFHSFYLLFFPAKIVTFCNLFGKAQNLPVKERKGICN